MVDLDIVCKRCVLKMCKSIKKKNGKIINVLVILILVSDGIPKWNKIIKIKCLRAEHLSI